MASKAPSERLRRGLADVVSGAALQTRTNHLNQSHSQQNRVKPRADLYSDEEFIALIGAAASLRPSRPRRPARPRPVCRRT